MPPTDDDAIVVNLYVDLVAFVKIEKVDRQLWHIHVERVVWFKKRPLDGPNRLTALLCDSFSAGLCQLGSSLPRGHVGKHVVVIVKVKGRVNS